MEASSSSTCVLLTISMLQIHIHNNNFRCISKVLYFWTKTHSSCIYINLLLNILDAEHSRSRLSAVLVRNCYSGNASPLNQFVIFSLVLLWHCCDVITIVNTRLSRCHGDTEQQAIMVMLFRIFHKSLSQFLQSNVRLLTDSLRLLTNSREELLSESLKFLIDHPL